MSCLTSFTPGCYHEMVVVETVDGPATKRPTGSRTGNRADVMTMHSRYFGAMKHSFILSKHNKQGMCGHVLTEISPLVQLFGVFGVVHH